jgi:hypothetical protein
MPKDRGKCVELLATKEGFSLRHVAELCTSEHPKDCKGLHMTTSVYEMLKNTFDRD